jgi:hypothetical protein
MRTLEKRLLVTRSSLECTHMTVRYIAGYTLHALSRRHGVSKARVSYLIRRTLCRMGAPGWHSGIKDLRDYRVFVLKEAEPWVLTLCAALSAHSPRPLKSSTPNAV